MPIWHAVVKTCPPVFGQTGPRKWGMALRRWTQNTSSEDPVWSVSSKAHDSFKKNLRQLRFTWKNRHKQIRIHILPTWLIAGNSSNPPPMWGSNEPGLLHLQGQVLSDWDVPHVRACRCLARCKGNKRYWTETYWQWFYTPPSPLPLPLFTHGLYNTRSCQTTLALFLNPSWMPVNIYNNTYQYMLRACNSTYYQQNQPSHNLVLRDI